MCLIAGNTVRPARSWTCSSGPIQPGSEVSASEETGNAYRYRRNEGPRTGWFWALRRSPVRRVHRLGVARTSRRPDRYSPDMDIALEVPVRGDLERPSSVHRAVGVGGAIAVCALVLAGCSADDQVSLVNDSAEVVTVELGPEGESEVPAEGGIVLHEFGECVDGPVVVAYASGSAVELDGPVCPGDELRITGTDATLSD